MMKIICSIISINQGNFCNPRQSELFNQILFGVSNSAAQHKSKSLLCMTKLLIFMFCFIPSFFLFKKNLLFSDSLFFFSSYFFFSFFTPLSPCYSSFFLSFVVRVKSMRCPGHYFWHYFSFFLPELILISQKGLTYSPAYTCRRVLKLCVWLQLGWVGGDVWRWLCRHLRHKFPLVWISANRRHNIGWYSYKVTLHQLPNHCTPVPLTSTNLIKSQNKPAVWNWYSIPSWTCFTANFE